MTNANQLFGNKQIRVPCRWALVLFAAAALTSSAQGQPAEVAPNLGVLIDDTEHLRRAQRRQAMEMAEDLAVFGQIVREDVQRLYATGVSHAHQSPASDDAASNSQFGSEMTAMGLLGLIYRDSAGAGQATQPLADYFPDFGAVIQLQAPPLQSSDDTPSDEPKKPALSRWERTRRQLLGDPPSAAEAGGCVQCHQAQSLSHPGVWPAPSSLCPAVQRRPGMAAAPTAEQLKQALMNTLAENGHHFRHLGPEDQVAISVSYPLPEQSVESFSRQASPQGAMSNQELMGDLLMKQHKYTAAVASYNEALQAAARQHLRSETQGKSTDADWSRLLNKMSRALRSLGKPDLARRLMLDLAGQPLITGAGTLLEQENAAAGSFLANSPFPTVKSINELNQTWDLLKRVHTHQTWAALFAKEMNGEESARLSLVKLGRIQVSAKQKDLKLVQEGGLSRQEFARRAVVRFFPPRDN